jgi:dephospho-CoA kinase
LSKTIKLIEAGLHRFYDALWSDGAFGAGARLVIGRGLTQVEAAVRVDAQPPQEEKAALADWVIVNDGDLDNLRRQVVAGWVQISGLS